MYRYITKYVSKPEPTGVYTVESADQHFSGRTLGALEATMFILGYDIIDCSVETHFLPTKPVELRPLLPKRTSEILANPDDMYYDGKVEKYIMRPREAPFTDMTYKQFWENYTYITGKAAAKSRIPVYYDSKGRPFRRLQRQSHVLRWQSLRPYHGEDFFFPTTYTAAPIL